MHFGAKSDAIPFLNNLKHFFSDIFFPYLKEYNIDTVVCLGDVMERRKFVNYLTAYYVRNVLINPLIENNIEFHWILGNHDIFYRETLEVASAKELYSGLPFNIYDKPTEVSFDGIPILFVPWICKENRELTLEMLNTSRAQILFGHLEVAGFEADKGFFKEKGDSPDLFHRFDVVLSGHYHHPSKKGNIQYLGAISQQDWMDYNDQRGFHVFDTSTRETIFVPNPLTMFEKVYYDDASKGGEEPFLDFSNLNKKIVKVIVSSKNNPAKFDVFMTRIEEAQPFEIQIVEDHLNLNLVDENNIVSESRETFDIMLDFVQQANDVVNAEKLKTLIVDLYKKAKETV